MATQDVMIIVDCESILKGVRDPASQIFMFADPSIVLDGQGTDELSIQVNNQDIIRWFVFPKVMQVQGSEDTYAVLAVGNYAWDKSTLLKEWTAYQGNGSIWTYQNDGVPLTQGQDVTTKRVTDYKPYIQANASLPGRPDPGTKQREAYYFYLNIYKGNGNAPAVKDYSWDPYVTVYQP
ncbi:AidA/PixA family protein [Sorangium sp. So ce513]|uniref:AidA/PixA family protein n=1 Tax=Sorangium sp. So ce513 TaxID=3133315 RepID=UPI003F629CA8